MDEKLLSIAKEPRRYSDVVFEIYIPSSETTKPFLGEFISSYILPPELRGGRNGPEAIPLPQFVTAISEDILPSAFESESSKDIIDGLRVLGCPQLHDIFLARAIRISLDLPVEKQKFLAATLTVLYDGQLISRRDVTRGFEKLMYQIEDTSLDVPTAYLDVMTYMNCLIEDGCLDADFVDRLPEHFLKGLLPCNNRNGLTGSALEELQAHHNLLKTFKDFFAQFANEQFLITGSVEDLQAKLQELEPASRRFRHEVVRILVKAGLDGTDTQRELVSNALSQMYGSGGLDLHPDDIYVGFCRLVEQLDDLSLDTPDAQTLLAKFIVRAIIDEVLPPVFVTDVMRLRLGGADGKAVARTVKKWVTEERRGLVHVSRFQDVWRNAVSDSPQMKLLTKTFRDLLGQHLLDHDLDVTAKSLLKLNLTPDQVIIFVVKALQVALEKDEVAVNSTVTLLHGLVLRNVLSSEDVLAGFERIKGMMPDVLMDAPLAGDMFRLVVAQSRSRKLIPEDVELV